MSAGKNVDRISLLPDCLLHHILSFLSTTQVVRTCVLSKRWKTIWTSIPTLYFHFDHYPNDGSTDDSESDSESKVRSFNHFVLRVLSEHCGLNIIKLRYYSSSMDHDDEKYLVEFFISYAACHMVQELDIDTYSENDIYFDWIRCLSACQSLNVLKIHSFFHDEWGLLMLPSLRILEIHGSCSDLNLKYKEKMFSGCPNLESLVLVEFCWKGCATICAPKLENFEFRRTSSDWVLNFLEIELCTPNLRYVYFDHIIPTVKSALDFPCLDKVDIYGGIFYNEEFIEDFDSDYIIKYGRGIAQLLRVFHNARSITLPFDAIEALLSIPTSISATLSFDNLRHLELTTCFDGTKISLPVNELRCLLKCPTLKTLVIGYVP